MSSDHIKEWNPLKNIDYYSIINKHRIPDYENAFMAAHFIQAERQSDQDLCPSSPNREESFPDSDFEHTAVQLTEIKERKHNNLRRPNRRLPSRSEIPVRSDSERTAEPTDRTEPDKLGILDSADTESLVARSVNPNWFTVLSMARIRSRLLWKKSNQNVDPLEAGDNSGPLVRVSNEESTGSQDSDNEMNKLKLELDMDSYARYFKVGKKPVDLKIEKLDFEIKTLQTTLEDYKNKFDAIANQLNRSILAGSNKLLQDQIKGALDLDKVPPKDLAKLLLTKLGRKAYFEIIRRSNLKSIYNQFMVSQTQLTSLRKQVVHLKRERKKWKEHLSRSTTLVDGASWISSSQGKLDELMENIQLEPEDFLRALRIANKDLEGIEEDPTIRQIFELPQWTKLDIRLFIRVAALSERVTGLESIIGHVPCKTDSKALLTKLRKSKELFCLAGGSDACQFYRNHFLLGAEDAFIPGNKQISETKQPKQQPNDHFQTFAQVEGHLKAQDLKLEFLAANLSPLVVDKLIQYLVKPNQTIDFLAFLEYLPLFIEVNNRILDDPVTEPSLPFAKSYANRFSYLERKY